MNQLEMDALGDNELPPFAVALYVRCFRRNMDFATGCVFVSYRRMAQDMEHIPPRGSTKPSTRPSRGELRHAVDQLIRVSLIKLVAKGSLANNKAAEYRCAKAVAFLGAFEEQPESNQGTTNKQKSTQATTGKGLPPNVVNLRKNEEQHKPDKPIDDDVYAREEILFSDDWLALASSVGLVASKEQIESWFNVWREGDLTSTYRGLSVHQKAWRKYCASIRANQVQQGGSNEVNQRNGTTGGQYRNATAETLGRCRERAQAGIGVGDFDFSDEA
tara:strand:+ start:380 stop:1201 length:822 start_codon:yes stop_codon:yes gene_type:complete